MEISFKDIGINSGIVSYEYICRCLYFNNEKYKNNNLVMSFECKLIIIDYTQRKSFEVNEPITWWINNPAYYSYILVNVDDPNKKIKIYETNDTYPNHMFSLNFRFYNNQIVPIQYY